MKSQPAAMIFFHMLGPGAEIVTKVRGKPLFQSARASAVFSTFICLGFSRSRMDGGERVELLEAELAAAYERIQEVRTPRSRLCLGRRCARALSLALMAL